MTTEGRIIAVALMLLGIGFISVLTATIASLFLDQDKRDVTRDLVRLEERLARMEQKQDEVLAAIQSHQQTL